MEGRVYRTRSQALVFLALGLFFLVFAVVVPVGNYVMGAFDWRAGVQEAIFLACALVNLRCARTGVFIDADGIRIRNPRGTVRLPWNEIERFTIGQRGFFSKIGIVETRSGASLGVFGIQGPNPTARPNNRDAEQIIEALNQRFAVHRSRPTGTPVTDPAVSRGSEKLAVQSVE